MFGIILIQKTGTADILPLKKNSIVMKKHHYIISDSNKICNRYGTLNKCWKTQRICASLNIGTVRKADISLFGYCCVFRTVMLIIPVKLILRKFSLPKSNLTYMQDCCTSYSKNISAANVSHLFFTRLHACGRVKTRETQCLLVLNVIFPL